MKRGRPKGYSPYVEITYEELADYVGRKSIVRVSKAWLESMIEQTQIGEHMISVGELANAEEEKIEFKLTDFNDDSK